MSDDPNAPLTEGETALLSAVEVLIDVLLAMGVPPVAIARGLKDRQKEWAGLPKAEKLLAGLTRYTREPRPRVEAIRKLLEDPPQGEA